MDSSPKSPVSTSADDKTDENEVSAPSPQLPAEGRIDSPTGNQTQKTFHLRSLYKEYVYVDVGPSKQRFGVHKGLICDKSKFFNAALNSSFSEAANGIVELVEEDPEIFDIAHSWLYTKVLTRSEGGKDVPCYSKQLAELFVLGDKLDMPLLCNKAIDNLKSYFLEVNRTPGVTLIDIAYTKTPENSPLRKLFVATKTFNPGIWAQLAAQHREEYLKYPEFLFDISVALQKQITQKRRFAEAPFLKDNSFHQDAEGEKDCSGTVTLHPTTAGRIESE